MRQLCRGARRRTRTRGSTDHEIQDSGAVAVGDGWAGRGAGLGHNSSAAALLGRISASHYDTIVTSILRGRRFRSTQSVRYTFGFFVGLDPQIFIEFEQPGLATDLSFRSQRLDWHLLPGWSCSFFSLTSTDSRPRARLARAAQPRSLGLGVVRRRDNSSPSACDAKPPCDRAFGSCTGRAPHLEVAVLYMPGKGSVSGRQGCSVTGILRKPQAKRLVRATRSGWRRRVGVSGEYR